MPSSYPRLGRFSLWLRWTLALCLILGGGGFSVWMALQYAHIHSWNAVLLWVAIGALFVVGGIQGTRQPKLSRAAAFVTLAFSLPCLVYFLYRCWRGGYQPWGNGALLAGGSVLWTALAIYRHYHAPAKGDAAPLGFWWWIDRRLK